MKRFKLNIFLPLILLIFAFCSAPNKQESTSAISAKETPFGEIDRQQVMLYTISNQQGMTVEITNYGGIITSLTVPDQTGKAGDVVLGYDNLQDYLEKSPYFGSVVGRYANRIAAGQFTLNEETYTLAKNNIGNHLHGGLVGFDKVIWDANLVKEEKAVKLVLTHESPDGHEGYPGNLQVEMIYTIDETNQIKIDYRATTDKSTIVNLTHHSYFNLTGDPKQTILGHELQIKSRYYLPVDSTLIPTGEFREVAGTAFDFNTFRPIGDSIAVEDTQIKYGGGYDHCWVFSKESGPLKNVASLFEPSSGRLMEILTTEPGMQFYSGNFLDGTLTGKGGVSYQYRSAVCMETQHFPDSPNKPDFPSVVLNPGEVYTSSTVYRFSVGK
ncbi:aldose epimerase family protein [Fulvivirgaceae bacterium BMA12]|uniref:Aldose 1-epimerase n=1 Tax=Agaribacillus aureus TaxID=3051825 RepID=A0ABT8LG02_9BACT|nr:aldose epimerase family protein [Fulvivirgaceae bacterium BMA12]